MRRLHRVEDGGREVRLNVVLFDDVSVVSTNRVEEGEVRHPALYCWSLGGYGSPAAPAAPRLVLALAELYGASARRALLVLLHCVGR